MIIKPDRKEEAFFNCRPCFVMVSRWMLFLAAFLLSSVAHAYTVTASPTSCANSTAVGTRPWTNPTNAYVSDNKYATSATVSGVGTQLSEYLNCTGYNFNIPTGATVSGITVSIERKISSTSSTTGTDNIVQLLKAGSLVGSNLATTTTYNTADIVEAHGSSSSLWGTTWAAADINNANFGVAYSGKVVKTTNSGTRTISVDQIQITVTYTFTSTTWPSGTYTLSSSPTNCADATGVGTLAWTNPTKAYTHDSVYATALTVAPELN